MAKINDDDSSFLLSVADGDGDVISRPISDLQAVSSSAPSKTDDQSTSKQDGAENIDTSNKNTEISQEVNQHRKSSSYLLYPDNFDEHLNAIDGITPEVVLVIRLLKLTSERTIKSSGSAVMFLPHLHTFIKQVVHTGVSRTALTGIMKQAFTKHSVGTSNFESPSARLFLKKICAAVGFEVPLRPVVIYIRPNILALSLSDETLAGPRIAEIRNLISADASVLKVSEDEFVKAFASFVKVWFNAGNIMLSKLNMSPKSGQILSTPRASSLSGKRSRTSVIESGKLKSSKLRSTSKPSERLITVKVPLGQLENTLRFYGYGIHKLKK
eukprot:151360_1